MNALIRKLASLLIAILTLYLFYLTVSSSINGILKFGLSVVLFVISGTLFKKLLTLEGDYGLVLLRTTKGLELMDKIANATPGLWRAVAELGYVFSFGAISKLLFRQMSIRVYLVSLLFLLFSALFILPILLPVASSIIVSLPLSSHQVLGNSGTGSPSSEIIPLLFLGLIFLGGFLSATLISLAINSFSILYSILMALLGHGSALSSTAPGAAPILPGINIPFYEGIIALAILIVVHEGAHGILARVEKIKLLSSGIVLFGVLPIGAFVDPDEKELQNQKDLAQQNVLVAGSTANFLTAFIAFLLLTPFLFTNAFYDLNKVVVVQNIGNSSLKPGDVIQQINGVQITSLEKFWEVKNSLKPGDPVTIITNNGQISTKLSNGKIGIFVNTPLKSGFLQFLYNLLGLTFVLNFLIGSVNLLPMPMFDGNRIVSLLVKNPNAMRIVNYLIIIFFIINLLPWIWR